MNHGVGRLITTVDGFITTVAGRGVHEVVTTAITVGGGLLWFHFITSTTTIAGTRSVTVNAIHDPATTTTNQNV
jgi:hypothetical protein